MSTGIGGFPLAHAIAGQDHLCHINPTQPG